MGLGSNGIEHLRKATTMHFLLDINARSQSFVRTCHGPLFSRQYNVTIEIQGLYTFRALTLNFL